MFENEENLDPRERFKQTKNLPIYKKAEEISTLVRHLVKSVENTDLKFKRKGEKELLAHSLSYLMESSTIIPAKIMGAESVELYDIKMENAAIIRKAARELATYTHGIEMTGFKDTEYLDLLRKEVEEFRILFAEWVKTFNPWDYIIDRWGLFNPPGINYDDHDPDDDIPFDPNNFPKEFFDDDYEEDSFDEDMDADED
ncbi:MAG TPA: hypothetical protein PKH16_10845 [Aequorivita sp.]|jgi:hypothetical protein|nr:hypothetical protein [Aequorivita sp.]MBP42010.1 hypothetical protein [Aequorivita sp.]HBC03749.1 hypothetical protein [Aequorivita sp.]HNP68394.1 hypothetical protein [Aequorivita sp.]|tara:strand:+ start:24075 stop:24671 length:597 start_codon:yes stop_codon:yes gene_type:complete